ncbi:MAG TPA: site-specific integrase, partial [Candidatus Limnocylindria bacterium]|nr:site-specific integrase [Candidatus Limnocylindria bacterium]
MNLDQAIDAYLDHVATERGLARKTLEAYARDLGAFARFLVARGVRSAARIGATEARAHLAGLAEHGLSARSRARALAAV